jgi:hypothetical protein
MVRDARQPTLFFARVPFLVMRPHACVYRPVGSDLRLDLHANI